MSGNVTPTAFVFASGDAKIDGLLTLYKWNGPVFYSFPATPFSYSYFTNSDWVSNMFGLNAAQREAVHFALNADIGTFASRGFSVEGFTSLSITNDATPDSGDTIRAANTSSALLFTAAIADFPSNDFTFQLDDNGDVWFGPYDFGLYLTPQAGNLAWHTHLHELGHALGLSHGHSTYQLGVALPAAYDAMEYSVMTYRSYVNGPLGGGYSNEAWGYAQTYMMLDIAALQYLYGADFTTNSGDTVYKWNPWSGDTWVDGSRAIDAGANRIFATIWDGGGKDTYDLSSYTTDLMLDLRAGKHSLFSATQQAGLGDGNFAKGNIYNALQYRNDLRSLIENATGGSGADEIIGNQVANLLKGGGGNDTLKGGNGLDVLWGETGNDLIFGGTLVDILRGGSHQDTLLGGGGNDSLFGDAGFDLLIGGAGNDTMRGGFQHDRLFGQENNDELHGDGGNDTLDGEAGNDSLRGGQGADSMRGGAGNDTLIGGGQNDTLDGGAGNDLLRGSWQNDLVLGGAGNDRLFGDDHHDSLGGGVGFDVLFGGAGNDTLLGELGLDRLDGGVGFDTLNGGGGNDTLSGRLGSDRFVFIGAFGDDVITDFEEFNPFEKIDLAGVASITSFADLTNPGNPHMTQVGADVVIDDFAGNTITILNTNIASLDASDFVF